jgi:hypothetical protein
MTAAPTSTHPCIVPLLLAPAGRCTYLFDDDEFFYTDTEYFFLLFFFNDQKYIKSIIIIWICITIQYTDYNYPPTINSIVTIYIIYIVV